MLAARWHGRRDVRVEEVPTPEPGPGEVLLDVRWGGICGTDVEEYLDGPLVIPTDEPNPVTGRRAPIILGHEFGGTVRSLGAGVGGLAPGDPVAVEVCLSCGDCVFCRSDRTALCSDWAAYGLQADGGLAEAVVVRSDRCLPRPSSVGAREAALVEPTEVAVRAVRKLELRAGEGAVVLGGGTVGILAGQVLRDKGAVPVIIATGQPVSAEICAELGLEVVDSSESDWEASVAERTAGLGPEVVVEAQGRPTSIGTAVRIARKDGRIVVTGILPGRHPIDVLDLVIGEKRVIGSVQHEREADLRPALDLVTSGAVRLAPLITGEIPLDRVVSDGLDALAAPDRRQVKVVVRTH